MASMNVGKNTEIWAESLTAITYMNFEDVQEWENTANTTAKEKIEEKPIKNSKTKKLKISESH